MKLLSGGVPSCMSRHDCGHKTLLSTRVWEIKVTGVPPRCGRASGSVTLNFLPLINNSKY